MRLIDADALRAKIAAENMGYDMDTGDVLWEIENAPTVYVWHDAKTDPPKPKEKIGRHMIGEYLTCVKDSNGEPIYRACTFIDDHWCCNNFYDSGIDGWRRDIDYWAEIPDLPKEARNETD